jgi:hypothetical protein
LRCIPSPFFDHRSEPLEQQPKNDLTLVFAPAQTLSLVVEDSTGSLEFEATYEQALRR